jgi:hypothetical protein
MEKRKFLALPGLELRPLLGRPARSQSLYRLHCIRRVGKPSKPQSGRYWYRKQILVLILRVLVMLMTLEYCRLVGHDDAQSRRYYQHRGRTSCVHLQCYTVKLEAAFSTETLLNLCEATLSDIPEDNIEECSLVVRQLRNVVPLLGNDLEANNWTRAFTTQRPVNSSRGTVLSVPSMPRCHKQDS